MQCRWCRRRGVPGRACHTACHTSRKGISMSAVPSLRRTTVAAVAFLALSIFRSAGLAAARKKIALARINQEALFFIQMHQGARAAAKAAGVDLVIHNANNEPSAQTNAIETYIQQKVDAILVAAIYLKSLKHN